MTDLLEILSYIPPSQLDYQEWVNVGMALKHEGYSCSDWDAWSRSDTRYKYGDCERKWKTFNEGAGTIVTGGTINEYAKRFGGYSPKSSKEISTFGWEDEISYDGDPDTIVKDAGWIETSTIEMPKADFDGVDQLRRYIGALFEDDEVVGFCTDALKDEDGKWKPATKGSYGMTAGQIREAIKKHPNDIKDIIGDYEEEAGAWIRFNPLDGHGVNNANVTSYKYALVESDSMDIERQKALMEELKLPIAIMVFSGGKSVHAIVKIGAVNVQEYRERVDYLYRICEKNHLLIDKQNKNPSRLSRMPGVVRGDKKQFIITEGTGCKDFTEWKNYIEELTDTLPDIINFSELKELPPLSPELIEGILRRGHKMLIAGASKAGKSFLLIELALCITSGKKWLGFQCAKGKVLYINLEVDGASFLHRVDEVRREMNIDKVSPKFDVWNLRGENVNIDFLKPRLIRRAQEKGYDAIIFDPLYKINEGDENSASEMGRFFNQLDAICAQLHTSVICCHHHSKGGQGAKFSIDRASGSGVFARDPDALLDMIQINPKDAGKSLEEGQTAWRIAATLREFRSPEDIDVIFDYPIHHVTLDLKDAKPISGQDSSTNSRRGNDVKTDKAEAKYQRFCSFVENWSEICPDDSKTPYPKITDAEEYFKSDKGFSYSTMKRWIREHEDFELINGVIFPKNAVKGL